MQPSLPRFMIHYLNVILNSVAFVVFLAVTASGDVLAAAQEHSTIIAVVVALWLAMNVAGSVLALDRERDLV